MHFTSTTSMAFAAAAFGTPGSVMISKQIITTNPAPAANRSLRMSTRCPFVVRQAARRARKAIIAPWAAAHAANRPQKAASPGVSVPDGLYAIAAAVDAIRAGWATYPSPSIGQGPTLLEFQIDLKH